MNNTVIKMLMVMIMVMIMIMMMIMMMMIIMIKRAVFIIITRSFKDPKSWSNEQNYVFSRKNRFL
jgi:ABC-type bacteriocin/lantibiotic exporter with double-glycine peptidase domain